MHPLTVIGFLVAGAIAGIVVDRITKTPVDAELVVVREKLQLARDIASGETRTVITDALSSIEAVRRKLDPKKSQPGA